jgi:hypothetical protein
MKSSEFWCGLACAVLIAGPIVGGLFWEASQQAATSSVAKEMQDGEDRHNAEVVAGLPFWSRPVSAEDVLRMAREAEGNGVWISPDGVMERTADAVFVPRPKGRSDGVGAVRLAILQSLPQDSK